MSANERSGGTSTAWVDASHVSTSSVVNVRGYVDNRPKDARDVERAKGVYVPPSVDEARAHGDATQPRQLNERGQLTGFSMLDQNLDLGVEFSPGLQGYFLVVKALALLFLALFALNVPVMFINYTSTYYASEYEADPLRGTPPVVEEGRPSPTFHSWYVDWHWANPMSASLGTVAPDNVPQREWLVAGATSGVLRWSSSKIQYLRFGVVMDIMGSVIVAIVAPIIIILLNQTDTALSRGTVTLRDYTVLVSGLPSDVNEEEVRCFFALKYGMVADVTLVKTECRQVNKQRLRLKLMEDYDEAEAALIANGNRGGSGAKDAIEKRIIKLDKKLARIKSRTRCKRVSAFVTFEKEETKIECLLRNRRSWFAYVFNFPRKERFRTKVRFLVRTAPEPHDVKFENLNMSNKVWRRLAVWLAVSAIVCFCYLFLRLLVDEKEKRWHSASMNGQLLADEIGIVIVKDRGELTRDAQASQFKTACQTRLNECGVAFSSGTRFAGVPWGAPPLVFYTDPMADDHDRAYGQQNFVKDMKLCAGEPKRCPVSEDMAKCYVCHCASQSYGLPDAVVKPYNKAIRDACEPYVDNGPGEYYQWLWNSFCIVLMNQILTMVVPALAELERFKTHAQTHARKTELILIAKYVNVALIYPLLNANLTQAAKYMPLLKQIFRLRGEYPDFEPEWYNDVGLVIFFVVMLSVTFDVIRRISTDLYTKLRRKIGVATAKTQKKLNEAFEGPELDIGTNCGDIAFKVLLVLTFSSSMPLLYLVLAMFFVLTYIYDWHLLLHVCRRPERMKISIVKYVIRVLLFGVGMHCLLGFWMWSYHWAPDVFKPKDISESLITKHSPLAYAIGGLDYNPLHNNSMLLDTVRATGSATEYFLNYHSMNIGRITDGDSIEGPPRVPVRFVERPWSETGMPFMVMMITVVGASLLWWIAYKIQHLGTAKSKIIADRKNLPHLHNAIAAGILVGSTTYQPRMLRGYRFLFEDEYKKSSPRTAESQETRTNVAHRGDSVNSRDEDYYDEQKYDDRYDASEYLGGAPWGGQADGSLYGGEHKYRGRGSRGTRQRDGGHGHVYTDGIPVDVRALGVSTDYNHRTNNAFDVTDQSGSDFEYPDDQDSDGGTLADDVSTQKSDSDREDEYVNDESRRPSWLH